MPRRHQAILATIVCLGAPIGACNRSPAAPDRVSDRASTTAQTLAITNLSVVTVGLFGATIAWNTTQPADSRVEFSAGSDLPAVATSYRQSSDMVTAHAILLTGLTAHTVYAFRAISQDSQGQRAISEVRTLTTAGASGTPDVNLTITALTVIEYQYPGDPIWYYAPQIEVQESTGTGNATVVRMNVSIPGLGAAPPYGTSKCVAAGQRLSLLHESYGDYEYSIFDQQRRSTGGTATAEVTFVDSLGRLASVGGDGPIVPGSPPSTYTAPPITWSCTGAGRQ